MYFTRNTDDKYIQHLNLQLSTYNQGKKKKQPHLQEFGYATKQSSKKIQLEKLSLTNFKGTKPESTQSIKKKADV